MFVSNVVELGYIDDKGCKLIGFLIVFMLDKIGGIKRMVVI